MVAKSDDHLLILWTSNVRETVGSMIFMYAENAKINGWWKEVTLLIWGASARLVAEDQEVQQYLQGLQGNGVKTIACKQCAINMNVVEQLEGLNIEVFYTGEFLTDWIKSGNKLITL